jgi:coenzyme F420-reducing hydrogenase gamma subunit
MKPRIAVHKFSSCDGCQLSLLNLGADLPRLASVVDIVHFAEAGPADEDAQVDIAIVEGSVSTPEELERIQRIRANSGTLVAIGACAVSGGLQALRNLADTDAWTTAIYARPEYIGSLATATPAAEHVQVDFEIWGCPVNSRQVTGALRDLLSGVVPSPDREKVCTTCKRKGLACVTVTRGEPCLGPVTNDGCGALCPDMGRGCYGCYGPAATLNTGALADQMAAAGLDGAQIARRFAQINSHAPAFATAAARARER